MLTRIQFLKPAVSRFFQSSSLSLQKLYVGNMAWTVNDESLRDMFEKHGQVSDAFIVRDRLTGKSRGFGFVEMESDEQAKAAIEALNGSTNEGRQIKVNFAEERVNRTKAF